MSEVTAQEICALLTHRPIPKAELRQLSHNEHLRHEVETCLNGAGYELVDEPQCEFYDARVMRDIVGFDYFIENNLRRNNLNRTAKAMLTILWGLLVVPSLEFVNDGDYKIKHQYTVTEEQLYNNFKEQIGPKKNLRTILKFLREYDFIDSVRGTGAIKAGPRLWTAVDLEVMYDRFSRSVIKHVVDQIEAKEETAKSNAASVMNQLGMEMKEDDVREE